MTCLHDPAQNKSLYQQLLIQVVHLQRWLKGILQPIISPVLSSPPSIPSSLQALGKKINECWHSSFYTFSFSLNLIIQPNMHTLRPEMNTHFISHTLSCNPINTNYCSNHYSMSPCCALTRWCSYTSLLHQEDCNSIALPVTSLFTPD